MMYLKWFMLFCLDLLLLPVALVASPFIALFTYEMPYKEDGSYTWGWIFGTFDNPPQGDEGFVRKHAWFIGVTTGWKGYLNRVQWMWRNNLYGYAKLAGITWLNGMTQRVVGNPDISDKYGIPGWYFVRLYYKTRPVGFEFYCVLPYSKTRDLRVRLGWKILTSKFKELGFAQLVGTVNPFDGYNTSQKG